MNRLRTQMRWIMLIIVIAFLLSTFLMYDSGSRGGGSPSGGGDYAVAEINGRNLMASTLYQSLRMRLETYGDRPLTSMDYQAVLEDYAIELQMDQEIRDSGVTVSDADVDRAMMEYVDQVFPTREAFHQYLERSGQKLDDYRQGLAVQLRRQKFVEESVGTIVVSDDEAVQFYDGMKNIFFTQPAGYNANLARFSSPDEARKVRALLSGGRPWNEATSGDVVASSDVLYITQEPMFVPDMTFNEGYLSPMRSSDIGVVSPIFEVASNDYAVGVKTERVEGRTTAYDEVSADIRAMLQQQKANEAVTNFSLGLLGRANIVILDPTLFPASEPDFQPVQPVTPGAVSADAPVTTAPQEPGAPAASGDQS